MDIQDKTQMKLVNYPRHGQSLLDYVLFLTIIIATLLIIGYYVRNSFSGKYREAAETFGAGEVYSPQDSPNRSLINPDVADPVRGSANPGVGMWW